MQSTFQCVHHLTYYDRSGYPALNSPCLPLQDYPSGSLDHAPEITPDFDDSSWTLIDLPHDMLIGGEYNQKGDRLNAACLPRGDGWYRKHFKLPLEWRDSAGNSTGGNAIWLAFEGVWQRSMVFLNGKPLNVDRTVSFEPGSTDNPEDPSWGPNGTAAFYGGHWNGYTGFTIRIDNASNIRFGDGVNVLAVHVDAEKGTGWWYEGRPAAPLPLDSPLPYRPPRSPC